jgi:hypothetical protein
VGALTTHNPMGFHGLLQGQLHFSLSPALTLKNSHFASEAFICVSCDFQNKQLLFPYTASTDWYS